ncbi:MAG: Hsp20/alpha crystallin family protein [Nevskia sp.]|nr:Hsp20/alpha crystallin family protein [Nevskia sp.]
MDVKHHWHLMERMENLLERVEHRVYKHERPSHLTAEPSEWHPPMDIRETPAEYLIDIELAGIHKDAIDVSLLEGMLTVHGKRPLKPPAEGERHHIIGRMYGHFSRTFALPEDADTDGIKATVSEGVLSVRLPKLAGAAEVATKIEVD